MMVYLSGPISSVGLEAAHKNFRDAKRHVEVRLGSDVSIVNPMELPEMKGWLDYMITDLMLLRNCDMIVMLPDWRQSRGAQIEHLVAQELGICIRYMSADGYLRHKE